MIYNNNFAGREGISVLIWTINSILIIVLSHHESIAFVDCLCSDFILTGVLSD